MSKLYLSKYDKDCLSLSVAELIAKYPNIPLAQIESDKREIEDVCCELNQHRFRRWLAKNKHLIWRF